MEIEKEISTREKFKDMKEITKEDYMKFIEENSSVIIEDIEIKLNENWNIKTYGPPEDYIPEKTTVWSFPDRGNWATHRGNYRGNWSPYIPRNLILKYTQKGDWILNFRILNYITKILN
ncbi:MAG TPA: hypothetical protein PKW23_06695 [Dictyoglomaceae bacterium]|nr:hypothetical protein [Dictyoglomaceae bacterium]HOL39975.1 hypothetical protein [Dictyoglomaceae bacterium]HPP16625.1 hypothetical protein [Dictyoglomaceae bacterium]